MEVPRALRLWLSMEWIIDRKANVSRRRRDGGDGRPRTVRLFLVVSRLLVRPVQRLGQTLLVRLPEMG
jgi:hypothetical protein